MELHFQITFDLWLTLRLLDVLLIKINRYEFDSNSYPEVFVYVYISMG